MIAAMRRFVLVVAVVPLLGAETEQCDCVAEEPAASTNGGFTPPTAVTRANQRVQGVWTEIGDADWSCLDTPGADQASTGAIMLSGTVLDFQTDDPVADGEMTAIAGATLNGNLGMATTSGVAATRGQYTMTVAMLPAGETRVGFKVDARDFLRTYHLGAYLDPAQATRTRDLRIWSENTANALPAFIGVVRDIAAATVTGTVRDCAGHEVSNAIAAVSRTSGIVSHVPDSTSFYFSAASTSLPVRHANAPATRGDGMFLVLDAAAQTTPAFVQIWGFPTAAELAAGDLRLLAEIATPLEANAIIDVELEPRRTP